MRQHARWAEERSVVEDERLPCRRTGSADKRSTADADSELASGPVHGCALADVSGVRQAWSP